MEFAQVNWIAIVIVAVFNMILGTLWYGPLFGKLWMRIIGVDMTYTAIGGRLLITVTGGVSSGQRRGGSRGSRGCRW